MRLALYQPDIPQNTGTLMRLAACLNVSLEIIEPAGFDMSDAALRRAGMDYLEHVKLGRHESWEAFVAWQMADGARLILLTTQSERSFLDFSYRPNDILLLGRESAGAPQIVHQHADCRLTIPIVEGLRSLNVAVAGAMVLGEALRQTDGFVHL